jgi:hypothetical protein
MVYLYRALQLIHCGEKFEDDAFCFKQPLLDVVEIA